MKLEWHNRWIRLVIEFRPQKLVFRRYRVAQPPLDAALARGLRRRTLSCLARYSNAEQL